MVQIARLVVTSNEHSWEFNEPRPAHIGLTYGQFTITDMDLQWNNERNTVLVFDCIYEVGTKKAWSELNYLQIGSSWLHPKATSHQHCEEVRAWR